MKSAVRRALLAFVALTMVAAFASPAAAEGAAPVIMSPIADVTVDPGYHDPLQIDFSGVTDYDRYKLRVTADNGYFYETHYQWTGTGEPVWSVTLPEPLYAAGEYKVRVSHDWGTDDEIFFSVRALEAIIVEPTQNSTSPVGSRVTAITQWTTVPPGTEVLTTIDGPGDNKKCSAVLHSSGESTSCRSYRLNAGSYVIYAEMVHPNTGNRKILDHVEIQVVKPINAFDVRTNRDVFYPLVKDGYKDDVTLRWNANAPSERSIKVLNERGNVVRRHELRPSGPRSYSVGRWTWNGRNGRGEKVAAGKYTLELTVRDAFGNREIVTRKVEARTRYRVQHWTSWRAGWAPTGVHATGACSAQQYYDQFFLDCWGGGGHATAKYNVRIHPNAYAIEWSLRTDQGCCYNGQFDKFTRRISADRYQIGITIGGTRSVYVGKAKITYKRKVLI